MSGMISDLQLEADSRQDLNLRRRTIYFCNILCSRHLVHCDTLKQNNYNT